MDLKELKYPIIAKTLKKIDNSSYASIEVTSNGELKIRDIIVQDYPDLLGADVTIEYILERLHYHSRKEIEKFKLVTLEIRELENHETTSTSDRSSLSELSRETGD